LKINALEADSMMSKLKKKEYVIIDSRDSILYASGHLKNAINIDAYSKDAINKLEKYLNNNLFVVYCTNFSRSEKIIEYLNAQEYKGKIWYITDGINGWKENELPITNEYKYKFSTENLKPIIQIFGNASYDIDKKNYAYAFSRAHFGFSYTYNDRWSTKIILDRGRPTSINDISITDTAGNSLSVESQIQDGAYYTMFLKFASVKWYANKRLSIEAGAILQKHYITQERFWGLRYVAQTFQDLYWKIPSSDLGFIAHYKINSFLAIDAAITNGEGPRIKQDAFGKVKFSSGLNFTPTKNIQSRIYYHNKQSGLDSSATEQMFSVFTGIKIKEKLRIGGEFNYMQALYNQINANSFGFSIFSAYKLKHNTELFLRYDRLINEAQQQENYLSEENNTLIGGISFSPIEKIYFSLNYQGQFMNNDNKKKNMLLFSMEFAF
jgi:rhodanese-related sulfurtransferase